MKTVYHKADSRGFADYGWLKSHHTFSFAHYYNPERIDFSTLRVINDDCVDGGMGFGTHPHKDMEIVSLVLSGDLAHKDNMGHESVIGAGDIQVMSAGTGITHSEMNASATKTVKFLQIWVLTRQKGVLPRYQQMNIVDTLLPNQFVQVLSPNAHDAGVWIHQDAWFSLAKFDQKTVCQYTIKKSGNGVYVFVIQGSAKVGDRQLHERDGLGVWDVDNLEISADKGSDILLIDVPMEITADTSK